MGQRRVLPDTNVCFPISLLDLVLRLDEAALHEVVWTEDLLDELARVWVEQGARTAEVAAKVCDDIRRAFVGQDVPRHEYEALIESMPGNDTDDHVHAAGRSAGDRARDGRRSPPAAHDCVRDRRQARARRRSTSCRSGASESHRVGVLASRGCRRGAAGPGVARPATAHNGRVMTELREAGAGDAAFLRDMLYLALYVRDGDDPFPRSVLEEPRVRHYVEGFGTRPGDVGTIAIDDGAAIGACWSRCFRACDPGYGWVAADVPEVTIAIVPGHRGRGLGRRLLLEHVGVLRSRSFRQVSLSVDPESPARRLYEDLGFVHVGWVDTSMTMLLDL